MTGIIDRLAAEKNLTNTAVRKLRAEFKQQLQENVKVKGETKKATVGSRFIDGRLDRITFRAPYYIYMQNFGFEGQKKNGINMRLHPTDVLNKALDRSNVLNGLIEGIAGLRGDEIVASINFGLNGQ